MNLLSKFCIALSATRKLNCVPVGAICVAVFFFCCVLEKNIVEICDAFPAQPVQGILKKEDSPFFAQSKSVCIAISVNHIQFSIVKLRFCIANCDVIPDKVIIQLSWLQIPVTDWTKP